MCLYWFLCPYISKFIPFYHQLVVNLFRFFHFLIVKHVGDREKKGQRREDTNNSVVRENRFFSKYFQYPTLHKILLVEKDITKGKRKFKKYCKNSLDFMFNLISWELTFQIFSFTCTNSAETFSPWHIYKSCKYTFRFLCFQK